MSIRCPHCGREYDITLFEFGRSVECDCGRIITPGSESVWDEIKAILSRDEEEKLDTLRRAADRVSSLIVSSDVARVDVEIEIEKTRRLCRELFPHREGLFDLIYLSRFKRLWEQFRDLGGD